MSKLPMEKLIASMLQSLGTGSRWQLSDTKILAYSKRSHDTDGNWQLTEPKAIWSNSFLLRDASPYFVSMIDGDFAEGRVVDLDVDPKQLCPHYALDRYIYVDDSDLESDDGNDVLDVPVELATSLVPEPSVSGATEPTIDRGPSMFVGPESPVSPTVAKSSKKMKGKKRQTVPSAIPGSSSPGPRSSHALLAEEISNAIQLLPSVSASPRYGHILIPINAAYRTWSALVKYIHTGQINFLPLRSSFADDEAGYRSLRSTQPDACSPKSLLRLATELEMTAVKNLALNRLNSPEAITSKNVVEELFSVFSSTDGNVELLRYQAGVLRASLKDVSVRQRLKAKLRCVAEGEVTHAYEPFMHIMQKLSARNRCQNCGHDNMYCQACGRYGNSMPEEEWFV